MSIRKLQHAELLEQRLIPELAKTSQKHPIILIINSIRSSYNIGSLFRTADSAGIEEIIICGYSPYPPRQDISKTALGADETVTWRYIQKAEDAICILKEQGWHVFAVELTDSSRDYTSLNSQDFPLALVVGNEITGVDQSVLELCDGAIEIPMYGVKHSLNVAVASGIVLYESVRKWLEIQKHHSI
jgi:tRNA G18 (ribose-2'-O)-methylase SpoU